ncbi:MAG: hypothetical protein ABSC06_34630 [Rhodopila sp.]
MVIAVDDTIERRWPVASLLRGAKIKARGIYRDPVRSSQGQFVKTSGLRWLSLAVTLPVPFAGRRWALPFLTVLAPSARWSEAQGKRHKTLTDRARASTSCVSYSALPRLAGSRASCSTCRFGFLAILEHAPCSPCRRSPELQIGNGCSS